MQLRDFVIKRLLLMIPVMFGVTLFTFVLSNYVGNPVAAYVGDVTKVSPDVIERAEKRLGLDRPMHERYINYMSRLLQGDWGRSPTAINRPVLEVIISRFPATAELAIFAMTFAIFLGIPLGILSAIKKDKLVDQVSRVGALSGVSMPLFWLGLMLQLMFFHLRRFTEGSNILPDIIMPTSRRWDQTRFVYPEKILFGLLPRTKFLILDSLLKPDLSLFIDALLHIILPAFCIAWLQTALIMRMTRMAMLETMRQDYILLAKAKGLNERVIIYRHALRNAIIPTLTIAGLALAGLLTGAVLTETVFSWPGLGRWAVQSVASLDFAAIMGFVIVTAFIYVLSNMLVDILYAYVDPRIRYD